MSRPLEANEDLDGAVLVSAKGVRRWRAKRRDRHSYFLIPLSWRGQAIGVATPSPGLRPIKRTVAELHANGWRRVA